MVSPPEHGFTPWHRQSQLGVLLAKGVMGSLVFFTWFRGTWSQVIPPPSSRLSSQEKAGQGCWVGLGYTHSLCWIWPCQGDWSLVLIIPS